MKNKKYGIFIYNKKSKNILGLIITWKNTLSLSKTNISLLTKNEVDENLKLLKKYFPKLLKKSIVIPIRLTRKKYPIPITINKNYLNSDKIKFKYESIIERRKRKLNKINNL